MEFKDLWKRSFGIWFSRYPLTFLCEFRSRTIHAVEWSLRRLCDVLPLSFIVSHLFPYFLYLPPSSLLLHLFPPLLFSSCSTRHLPFSSTASLSTSSYLPGFNLSYFELPCFTILSSSAFASLFTLSLLTASHLSLSTPLIPYHPLSVHPTTHSHSPSFLSLPLKRLLSPKSKSYSDCTSRTCTPGTLQYQMK